MVRTQELHTSVELARLGEWSPVKAGFHMIADDRGLQKVIWKQLSLRSSAIIWKPAKGPLEVTDVSTSCVWKSSFE